jgi:two-component sensor histidine kinase/CHASE3 domain sensor protein
MRIVTEREAHLRRVTAKRRALRRLSVFASLVLIGLAGFAALVAVQGINRQLDDVLHTYEVRNQASELTMALAEAEGSQRGYVMTGDELSLQSYQHAVAGIGDRVQSLMAITKDDSTQVARIRDILGNVARELDDMSRSVKLRRAGQIADAEQVVQSSVDDNQMVAVRDTLQDFIAEENSKLVQRNAAIEWSRHWLVGTILAALGGAALLGYLLLSGSQRQVSRLTQHQAELLLEKEALEAVVRERTQGIEEARAHAEHERHRVEALLKDTNHRIGNSLATVSSLLGLQLMRSTSEEVRKALEAARARVHAVASAHRRLRLGEDLETTSADEFLNAVIEDLAIGARDDRSIEITGDFMPLVISARDATTMGILVAELVTNALKHGFPAGRSGTVTVRLARDGENVPVLSVCDDGIGMDEGQMAGEGGLGSVIIKQLANQFGGTPVYEPQPAGGIKVSVALVSIAEPSASTHSA